MIESYLAQLSLPQPSSHKGANGKTLIIGGSDLFHAASQWSFQVVSRIVDMTFYSSVAENNDIVQDAKFWLQDGVVVKRSDLPNYLKEVDSVLIGPGMRRDYRSRFSSDQLSQLSWSDLNDLDWEFDTQAVTAVLLQAFPDKQWVIDAGALQVLQPAWLPPHSILTPHQKELTDLANKVSPSLDSLADELKEVQHTIGKAAFGEQLSLQPAVIEESDLKPFIPVTLQQQLKTVAKRLNQAQLILKGQTDIIWNEDTIVAVVGGNAGLTKGGSGDTLAGLMAALVATSPPLASMVVSSFLNKLAGHHLYEQRQMMYHTSDLVAQIPLSWRTLMKSTQP